MQSSYTSLSGNLCNDRPASGRCVYFIGIGGIGMSAVARILISEGCRVSGSDIQPSALISALERMGARIDMKQDGRFMTPEIDMVVISAAITEDNPDLRMARKLGIKVVKYSQILGSLMRGKCGIAISGTHGKTTTSAMISTILKKVGLDPTFVIGGEVPDIGGNAHLGKGDLFVAEACEYDRSFLNLTPHVGVITNIEEDHLDYYGDIETIINAFGDFAALISESGLLIVRDFDMNVAFASKKARCRVETFSLEEHSDWSGKILSVENGTTKFRVFKGKKFFGDFLLKIPGSYNVLNALAAIAVATFLGVDRIPVKIALESFRGANRRFQIIDVKNGITIIDDYAHHPTEVCSTLKAAREIYPEKRIWCIFQPHQHSRTHFLLHEFANSFQVADRVVFADIYSARDNEFDKITASSEELCEKACSGGINARYLPKLCDIADFVSSQAEPGDIIITMGAGDIWKVAHDIASRL